MPLVQSMHPGSLPDLKITLAGHEPAKQEWVDRRFDCTAIGLVSRGRGRFAAAELESREVTAPFFFGLRPGTRARYGPGRGETWEERFLVLEGGRVDAWIAAGWFPSPGQPVPLGACGHLNVLHAEILDLLSSPDPSSQDLAALKAEQWMLELFRAKPQPAAPRTPEEKVEAIARRWWESSGPADPEAAAREVRMSYSSFRAYFTAALGRSPYRYLLELRIRRACLELADPDRSIKAIAADAGFNSLESFYRAFKRQTGSAPGQYRHHIQAWQPPGASGA